MLNTQLVAFLEGKRPDEKYNYHDSGCCGAAQFNASIGRIYPVTEAVGDRKTKATFDGRLESIARAKPHTFGDMLERARKEFADA